MFSYSQESSDFHFKRIQVSDGLSENAVYCILQDSKGFMWFGTKDGLNRYDGHNFRIFRNNTKDPSSIGNNFIRSIIETRDNHLYVGTDAGLYIMDREEMSFTKMATADQNDIEITTAINTLHEDHNGQIWIGTMLQGVFLYTPETDKLEKIEVGEFGGKLNTAWTISQDASGTIWVGTRSGLLKYNQRSNKLEVIKNMFSTSKNSKHEIFCMYEDDIGDLWLGTWSEGLRHYNKRSNSYTSYLGPDCKGQYVTHIRSIFRYDTNTLFIGSDDGLYLFNMEEKSAKRIDVPHLQHSLSDQNVYSITKDREGGIWIGTYFGGINYISTNMLNIETYYPNVIQGTLSGKAVSQFCEDEKGNLWIATEDGGINYFETKTKKITQPIRTSYHNTHALTFDGDDLWIGTFSRGIDIYNTKTKQLSNLRHSNTNSNTINDDCIFSLYRTKDGDIYVGTPVGLNKYNRDTKDFTRIDEIAGFVYDIKEDESGNIWIATYGWGVKRYNINTQKWVHYDAILDKANPIVGGKLTGIYIDSQKRVVFTSEGKGIFVYDYQSDNFTNFSETDGLPNNVTYGILDDPLGNWWISSNKGIFCFNIANPQNIKLYNKDNGLQSNQFNYKSSYKARNGKFYFGGINGFSSFHPQNLSKSRNNILPSVEITNINILGDQDEELNQQIHSRLNKKQKIKLPYNKSSFTISYISLSYVTQAKNQYAYMLEGADYDWNYAGNTKDVTYVSPGPGKYLFKVMASNNDGVWNRVGTQIEIEILPPFWLSMPAKIFYAVLLLSIIYLLISSYLRKARRQQEQQLEAFKIEQETLAFKSKIDFFTTIAHEIRTPLSLITAPLEEVTSLGEGSNETKQNLSIIEKNCERLKVLINQLLDFRKMDSTQYVINPEEINLHLHIKELYDRFKKTAQRKKIDLLLELPQEKPIIVYSDSDVLTKIIGNLLTNALKYTKDSILLTLTCNSEKSYIIRVEDNGRGILDQHKKLIFDPFYQVQAGDGKVGTGLGLSLVKNLSEVLDASIQVVDNAPSGTAFIFTFSDIKVPSQKEISYETEYKIHERIDKAADESKYKILVVEDNEDMSSFIKNSLTNDYTVSIANNGSIALELLETNSYDIIVSDIMMPEIDGITFTKKLKSDINYSHIPIILLSAKIENAVKVEGLMLGADVFIEKPFSISHLKAQINSLLENRKHILEVFNRSPLAPYSSLVTNKHDEEFLNRLNDEIEKHISDETFSVESLTSIFNMSRSNLQRKLKTIADVTPGDYLRNYRLKKACMLLLETDMRINEVAFSVGFNSASYFTKVFQKTYNMLPKEFVNKHLK